MYFASVKNRIFMFHPCFPAWRTPPGTSPQASAAEEGTDAIVRLATLPKDGPTGTFQDRNGTVPW
jgi:hypothetical protein